MTENFNELNVSKNLVSALAELGAVKPTQIQQEVIPEFLSGKDIVAQAPTGTGKTFAFGLPAIMNVDFNDESVQTLVLCPTRELVMQIAESLKKVLKYTESIRTAAIYGGQNIQKQLAVLRRRPQIVIGTPGRTLDHIARKTLRLNNIRTLILDEADEMLDMGFRGDIDKIISNMPLERQTALFSATLSDEIMELTKKYLKEPMFIKATLDGKDIPEIKQYYVLLKDAQRIPSLIKLIKDNEYKLNLVFCNTKTRADKVNDALKSKGVQSEVLHGDLRQNHRDRIMKQFRSGELNVLVATDVAARGIDVKNVDAVFNFDPPADEEFYVHRIGRTARAENTGVAYTFVGDTQTSMIGVYQKVTKTSVLPLTLEDIGDSYTLPRDSSNRRAKATAEKIDATRFFLNVGTRDGLDKESLKLILKKKGGIDEINVFDIKLRDNYSFVETPSEFKANIMGLIGIEIGSRELNIEVASPKVSGKLKEGKERSSRSTPTRSYGERKRDGDSKPRYSRSSDGDSKPRYSRSSDGDNKPRYSRSSDGDSKPRYSRSSDGDSKPRYSRSSDGDSKPRYSRSSDGDSKPRYSRSSDGDSKPRYSRSSDGDNKPRYSRSSDGDSKPRYSRSSDGESKPRYSRSSDGDSKPRYSRSSDGDSKPRYSRSSDGDSKPRYSRSGESGARKKPTASRVSPSDKPRRKKD